MQELKTVKARQPANAGGQKSLAGFYESLIHQNHHDLSAHVAIQYYKKVSPLFHAIDLVAREVQTIDPVVYDLSEDQYDEEHDLLKLLDRPNPTMTRKQFVSEMTSFWKITGNAYMVATGSANRAPLELYPINPTRVSIEVDQKDGFVRTYRITAAGAAGQQVFKRKEERRGSRVVFRYLTSDSQMELFHLSAFDPESRQFGMSVQTPVYYEIEQYLQSSVHNLSLLRNGATVSGMFVAPEELNDDQYVRLREEISRYFQGAMNAGVPLVADSGMKFENMSQSNKDMDFLNLRRDSRDMIYNVNNIPLAYVSSENMTLNNLTTAKFILYDNAVLPDYKTIMDFVSGMLLPRMGEDPTIKRISYVEDDISALSSRHVQQTKELKDTQVLTINELRSRLGYSEIDGGDRVFAPSRSVPVGRDTDTGDNLDEDIRDNAKQELTRQLQAKGYDDEAIERIAFEHGLTEKEQTDDSAR